MNTVTVTASKTYAIRIGSGLLSSVGTVAARLGNAEKVCIISDSNVWPLYGETVKTSLLHAGFSVAEFVFPAGEAHKNAATYLAALNFLAENQLTRTDLIVALGGGVVGDLAGFAAATYLRGIRYVQIPTTLLAAVDSSVGGKTGIDLSAGKNLAGAFWQPSAVLCDTATLTSLPENTFRDGCAEVIKYAVLYDPELFSHLEAKGMNFDPATVITRCVQWKSNAVASDEFDTGARMMLNLGHTFGHGIEAHSQFTLSHGQAVAIGMAIISRAFSCPDTERILSVLDRFGLPIATDCTAEDICRYALSDKKRSGSTVNLVVPESIGNCRIVPTPVENLKSIIEAGL